VLSHLPSKCLGIGRTRHRVVNSFHFAESASATLQAAETYDILDWYKGNRLVSSPIFALTSACIPSSWTASSTSQI